MADVRSMLVITSLGAGGTERSTAVLLPRLVAEGIDPIVVCLKHELEGDESAVIDAGFDVRVVAGRGIAGRVRKVREVLRDIRPDLVHTALFDADIAGRLAAVGSGVPVLSSLVNTPYDAARLGDPAVHRHRLRVAREIDHVTALRCTDHFHAVTEGVADHAVRMLGIDRTRVSVVERGRDPVVLGRRDRARRVDVRQRLGVSPETALVLAVGRQEFQKAHADLVRALAQLAERNVVVWIAGRRGNASRALEAEIASHGLGDRVRLLGQRDDVAELLVAADVFAMPSRYEGTAGAAVEALALETPIVASDLEGTRGVLVNDVNALLVPPADPTALARAIIGLLDDPTGATDRAGRGRALFEDRFTLERSGERMARLYRQVVAQGRR